MFRPLLYRTSLLLGVLALLLTACDAKVNPTATVPVNLPATSAVTPPPTATSASSAQVEAVDALGRTVRLSAPPRRVVLAGKASLLLADAVYAFPDASQRVVALTKGKQTPAFLALLDPKVPQKAVLAREVGPEQVAALHPDLVIIKSFLYPKLGKALEGLGILVFTMKLEAPEQYPRELRQLGRLLGEPERGEQIAQFYETKVQAIRQALNGSATPVQPRVLLVRSTLRGGQTAYAVPPRDWIQARMVALAGGVPVWTDVQGNGWVPVTLDQIAAWDPEQVFVISYETDPAQAAAEFSASSVLSALKAVSQQHVYPIPKDFLSWDQPDTRWILGMEWMTKHLHPDLFANLDMRAAVKEFYGTLYGLHDQGLQPVWEKLGW